MSTVTLADAKLYLGITGTASDVELQTFIDTAEAMIGKRCGPIAATATTSRVRGGGYALPLPVTPAISLTSVTPADGAALTLADLYIDQGAGVVTYNSGASFPVRYYTVVYSAGRTTCPADLLTAVKELLRHLWDTQRGPRNPRVEPVPGAAHSLPYRVTELIAPHIQPGFA